MLTFMKKERETCVLIVATRYDYDYSYPCMSTVHSTYDDSIRNTVPHM